VLRASLLRERFDFCGSDYTTEYLFDSIGNRKQITTLQGNYVYDYDLNNQIERANNPVGISDYNSEKFLYDNIGNRTSDSLGYFSYEATGQRLDEDANYSYFYDNNGNLTSKTEKELNGTTINYIYSSENQLTGIKKYNANNQLIKDTSYLYDAIGRRVKKISTDYLNSSNSVGRHYAYDGNELLFTFDQNNELLASYTHSGLHTDDVLSVYITRAGKTEKMAKADGSYYFLKDALGSVIDITDPSGVKLQHYTYSAFGKLLNVEDGNGVCRLIKWESKPQFFS
jgi:hypothetical protein